MRILFVTATRVGDAVLSTGVLARLVEQNPGARVTVACGPAAAGLFEAAPGLERIIVLDKRRFKAHWLKMWLATVGQFWDHVVDMRNSPITYLLAHRHGWRVGRRLLDTHRVVRNGAILGLAETPPLPTLWLDDQHEARARALMGEGGPIIAAGPVANWRAKTWAAARFLDLFRRLTRDDGPLPGARIAVFGSATERPQAETLLAGIAPCNRIDLMGMVSLLELYACLKRTALFVGNDSGLMHMAAAAGVPTIGLFGPSREDLYAPWGEHCRAVRGDQSYDEIFPEDYDHRNPDQPDLMAGLSVDRVEAETKALLREVGL